MNENDIREKYRSCFYHQSKISKENNNDAHLRMCVHLKDTTLNLKFAIAIGRILSSKFTLF